MHSEAPSPLGPQRISKAPDLRPNPPMHQRVLHGLKAKAMVKGSSANVRRRHLKTKRDRSPWPWALAVGYRGQETRSVAFSSKKLLNVELVDLARLPSEL